MADLGFHFDPSTVPPSEYNGEPFPAGVYRLQITESEVMDTKANTGKLLKLKIEVMDGDYQGRVIWDQINIVNQNPQAQSIGQSQLAQLFFATGIAPTNDSEHLHFKPFFGDVRIEQDKAKEYPPKNVIKKYKPVDGGAAPVSQIAAKPAVRASTAPASTGSRPWANRAAG